VLAEVLPEEVAYRPRARIRTGLYRIWGVGSTAPFDPHDGTRAELLGAYQACLQQHRHRLGLHRHRVAADQACSRVRQGKALTGRPRLCARRRAASRQRARVAHDTAKPSEIHPTTVHRPAASPAEASRLSPALEPGLPLGLPADVPPVYRLRKLSA